MSSGWSRTSWPGATLIILTASALTLVASEGGVARGGLILGVFGVGAAIPLVVVAYASRAGFTRARNLYLPSSILRTTASLRGLPEASSGSKSQ